MSEVELLERRVAAVEQEVEGETLVIRHVLEQTRRNGDDIAAMRTQLGRVEARLDKVEVEVHGVRIELRTFRENLPTIVGDTMREVLRERDGT